jgi:hypothetical protein
MLAHEIGVCGVADGLMYGLCHYVAANPRCLIMKLVAC